MENIYQIKGELRNPVVTLGTFDGVHLGHQKIMEIIVQRAEKLKGKSVVATYHPHPLEILREEHYPYLLLEKEKKEEILKKLGIDFVLWLDFDKKMSNKPPQKFVKDCFVDKLDAREIILGYDWHFGRNREGDYHLMKKLEKKYDFSVDVVEEVLVDGKIVSSTQIRDYINQGNIADANKMLGRNYSIYGKIQRIQKNEEKNLYECEFQKSEFRKLLPTCGIYRAVVTHKNNDQPVILRISQNNKKDAKKMSLLYSDRISLSRGTLEVSVVSQLDLDVNNLDNNLIQKLLQTKR